MASPTLAPRPRRRLVVKLLGATLLVLLLALSAATFWFYSLATSSLAQLSGTVRLAGLSAPVTVTRDARGTPHILAATPADLFFAQGYVAAQDRLWQMDLNRRYAAGELAEIFGADFFGTDILRTDRVQRTLLLRPTAQRALASLPARERSHLDAYSRGVNAYIDQHRANLPVEFRLLRYQPRPWTAEDSMLVVLNMVQALNHGFYADELAREKVAAKLPADLLPDLYPVTSFRDLPPTSRSRRIAPDDPFEPENEDELPADDNNVATVPSHLLKEGHAEERRERAPSSASEQRRGILVLGSLLAPLGNALDPDDRLRAGSNNWVVSGAHTVSGKPLLANDMHLRHSIPNVWYQAQLELSQPIDGRPLNVAGVTLPGFPYVLAGHNQRIAWGYTNLGPDVQDVYVETFNDRGEYLTPAGWRQPERRTEIIKVKGAPDVTLDVLVTRHGPIITGIVPGETRRIALRWNIYEASTPIIYWDLNLAANWDQFRAAWSTHVVPALNVVYADVDGHIGYQAAGSFPVRSGWDGALPVSGADDAHVWTATIPFAELPSVFDPASGMLATANSRVSPDGYKYSLSNQWFPPYRQERIYRMLASGRKFSAADMLALQMDVFSEFDRFTAERIVYAVDHAANATDRARDAADLLRSWDGRVTASSPAPVLTSMTRKYLWQLLLEPYLGPPPAPDDTAARLNPLFGVYKEYGWGMQSVAMENLMLRQPQRWLPQGYSSWNDLIAAALDRAVNDPDAPRKLDRWTYGRQFPLNFNHPLFGSVPVLKRWAGPGAVPQDGNSFTVKAAGRSFGASQRFTIDLADLDASLSNIVTGQSGQLFSPHYWDHWQAWYSGASFPLPFSPDARARAARNTLTLEPK